MQPENLVKVKLLTQMWKAIVKKKMKMTQRNDNGKSFTLKKISETFHDIGSTKDKVLEEDLNKGL